MSKKKSDKNNDSEQKKSAGKFDFGSFLKGIFQKKEKPEEKQEPPVEEKPGEEEVEAASPEEDTQPRPKKPRTKATIEVAPEKRVFQNIAIVGKPSGSLHNMETILLRRGYDVVHIPLVSSKRGTFARLEFGRPIPEETECAIICEPDSLDEARFAIQELRDKKGYRIAIVSRKLSTPQWAKEILQNFNLHNKFLVRFSYNGLLKIFHRLAAEPPPQVKKGPAEAGQGGAPRLKLKKDSETPPPPAPSVPEAEPDLFEVPELEEVSMPEPGSEMTESRSPDMPDLEPRRDVLSTSTNRPMAILAKALGEPMVHFQVKGKEDEGIDPDRILSRREFEALFHATFKETWKITRIQDPRAMPPLVIQLEKLPEETEATEEQLDQEQERIVDTIAESVSLAPQEDGPESPSPKEDTFKPVLKKPVDLDNKIKDVRKWWQQGRTQKIYNELESLRCSGGKISDIEVRDIEEKLVPLVEGSILFAKGRLDRTVDGTLNELFTEDLAKNGLESSLRLAALADREKELPQHRETMETTRQGIRKTLESLTPGDEKQEEFCKASEDIQELLIQLDELVEGTLSLERVTPPMIYDYFDKLHKITMAMHNKFHTVDPTLLIFGRLDRVIVRSQTRSDWAFDHTENDDQWTDRLQKFLHFLAEIRIETFRVRDEMILLEKMVQQGLDPVIQEAADRTRYIINPGTIMERLDTEHLRLTEDGSQWHIIRHRGNYLIDLKNEEEEQIRAFAAFDEEKIEYGWIGIYQHPRLRSGSMNETDSE